MGAELLVVLALIVANGVFAGAEIAVISVRPGRLKELVERGSKSARALQGLRDRPERFFATVQIGVTVVSATASAFGGATLARELAAVFTDWPPIAHYATQLALVLVVAVVSYFSLVLGELVPKSLALKASETYALVVARPLLALSVLLRPLVWFLTASSNAVLFPFKDKTTFTEARMSAEELVELMGEAKDAGTLHPEASQIATRALELPELVASDVMVPRTEVVCLRRGGSHEELRRIFLEHGHSRYPVVEGNLDHVIGYVSAKDVLNLAWDESLFALEDLVRPAFFVPPGKRAVELIAEMRTRRVPFSVVVDEHGGMAGIVTLEDVLEELVGEILSEHTRKLPAEFVRDGSGAVTVPGTSAIREVNRELGLSLPEGDWTTIAGLCLAIAHRIPAPGDHLQVDDGPELEVVDASPRQVQTVRIHLRDSSSSPPPG